MAADNALGMGDVLLGRGNCRGLTADIRGFDGLAISRNYFCGCNSIKMRNRGRNMMKMINKARREGDDQMSTKH